MVNKKGVLDIENLTIAEAKKKLQEYKQLYEMMNMPVEEQDSSSHWKVGKNYFIRTVAHHYTGKLVLVTKQELVLQSVAWIADDGRFNEALKKEQFSEVEPYPEGDVIIGRGAVLDAIQIKTLPRDVK